MASDVKWIKITTDIFDDEKILLIESLPDAYAIITVWFKLLCLAGKQNNSGVFMMGHIAYTDKMLATIFRMKESTVTMALNTFEQFGMVAIVDGVITIPNWGKHQNLEQIEARREYQKEYQREYRKKQKLLTSGEEHKDLRKHLRKDDVNSLEEEREEDKELDKEIKRESIDCQQIVDLYNSICTSFSKVNKLTGARRKAIKARLSTYTPEDFRTVFENAEGSSFLKGANDRNWTANFDWLIKDSNMAKVLEGNYQDKASRFGRKEMVPSWMNKRELDEDELAAIKQMMGDTAGNNPEIAERAERLRQSFQK